MLYTVLLILDITVCQSDLCCGSCGCSSHLLRGERTSLIAAVDPVAVLAIFSEVRHLLFAVDPVAVLAIFSEVRHLLFAVDPVVVTFN